MAESKRKVGLTGGLGGGEIQVNVSDAERYANKIEGGSRIFNSVGNESKESYTNYKCTDKAHSCFSKAKNMTQTYSDVLAEDCKGIVKIAKMYEDTEGKIKNTFK